MISHTSSGLRRLTTQLLTTTLLGLSLLGSAAAEGSSRTSVGREAMGASPDENDGKDLQGLLPLLLTSQDRRQLAAELAAFIRKGDLRAAETSLNTAIEVGTFAIVLADHLKDPDLLRTLQKLDIQTTSSPGSSKVSAASVSSGACTTSDAAAGANLAELQEALEQERSSSATISQTLTALMQEHNALAAQLGSDATSQERRWAEMQQALQQEQERSEGLKQELASLQKEHQALQAARKQDKAPPPAEASARQPQERAQSDQTERQLAVALKDLSELQSLKDEIVASASSRMSELETALTQARMRSDALTRELASATEELRSLKQVRQPNPATIEAAVSPPRSKPAQPEATPTAPARNSAPVVVASLPEGGIQPLPLPVPDPRPAPAAAEPAKADDRLTSRADELLRKGDVSGARLLLERALASGNARAAFLLAETFDPNVLSKLGTRGIRGDPAKAREFYTQAKTLGMAQAQERLEALR